MQEWKWITTIACLLSAGNVYAEPPADYGRNEAGYDYQATFDLRKRWFVGADVAVDTGWGDQAPPIANLRLETGIRFEEYERYDRRRNKHRILEGSLALEPLEAEGVLWQYDRGRNETEPSVWVTTFIGEPKRYDINIHIGPGMMLGRVDYKNTQDIGQLWVDIGEAHINWEMFQSSTMANYFLIRLGAGNGVRWDSRTESALWYYYPEVSLEGAAILDERGLTEIRGHVRARLADEPSSAGLWMNALAELSFERILIAVNDQPISIYTSLTTRITDLPQAGEFSGWDYRANVGLRISLFTPPNTPADPCPGQEEDFDDYQDADGCPDPDNDADGVLDDEDRCPNTFGPIDNHGCP